MFPGKPCKKVLPFGYSPRCGDVSTSQILFTTLKRYSPRCGDVSNQAFDPGTPNSYSPRCGDVSACTTKEELAAMYSPRCGDVSYRLKMPLTGTLLSPQNVWSISLRE